MNTATHANQTLDTMKVVAHTTPVTFRRGTLAGALLITTLAATAVGLAATSHADDGAQVPNFASSAHSDAVCKTELFGILGSQRRTLCDRPISSDGSWSRERTIWIPAHRTASYCSSSSDRSYYSWSSNCSGGYFVDQSMVSNETYPVRPDTVLPDEPGHLS
jgi:hypothetical protein